MRPYVYYSVINSSKAVETTQVPISRWIDKRALVHIYSEYYLALKKNKILPSVTAWIDLEGIVLSERSQSEKDKYRIFFTYVWNLKNSTNEQTKQKQTHRNREQTDGCQRGGDFGDGVRQVKRLRIVTK